MHVLLLLGYFKVKDDALRDYIIILMLIVSEMLDNVCIFSGYYVLFTK